MLTRFRVEYHHVVHGSVTSDIVSCERGAPLLDVLKEVGFPSGEVDLASYYPVRDAYCTLGQLFPFLIIQSNVRWHVGYDQAGVSDVLSTLRVSSDPLRINVGIPQAGGPGVQDVMVLWDRFYEAIKAIDPVAGVGGSLIGLGTFVGRLIARRRNSKQLTALADVPPGAVFSLVMREEQWEAQHLASLIGISRKDAKHLLQLCRYRWEPRSKRYCRTADSARIVRTLNDVEQYDVL